MCSRRRRDVRASSLAAVIGWLSAVSRPWLLCTTIVLVGAIGAGDYLTGPDLSFSVIYLIPVFLSATAGRLVSAATAGAVALTWTSVELVQRSSSTWHPLVTVWNTLARFLVLWLVAALVLALATKLATERGLSRTDPLTRLANARAFHEIADAEIIRMRLTRRPLTVAYVDIDDFKAVNDTYGHSAGDNLLGLVAETMTRALRGSDHIARIGGDEFALLLPDTDLDDAILLITRLHAELRTTTAAGARPVSVSIGAAAFSDAPTSGQVLIDAADRVMYKAKQHGKNVVLGERSGLQESAAAGIQPSSGSARLAATGSSTRRSTRTDGDDVADVFQGGRTVDGE